MFPKMRLLFCLFVYLTLVPFHLISASAVNKDSDNNKESRRAEKSAEEIAAEKLPTPVKNPAEPATGCAESEEYLPSLKTCCGLCGKGHGMALPCTRENTTRCEPCTPGETYSHTTNSKDECKPCSQCPINSRVKHACNTTHNTVCECNSGYYNRDNVCTPCRMCTEGHGVARQCGGRYGNTVCMPCVSGRTFSLTESSVDRCRPCSPCAPGQDVEQACTRSHDTICTDIPGSYGRNSTFLSAPFDNDKLFPYVLAPASVLVLVIGYFLLHWFGVLPCRRSAGGGAAGGGAAGKKKGGFFTGGGNNNNPHQSPLAHSLVSVPGSKAAAKALRMSAEAEPILGESHPSFLRDLPRAALEAELETFLARPTAPNWRDLARAMGLSADKVSRLAGQKKPVKGLLDELVRKNSLRIDLVEALKKLNLAECAERVKSIQSFQELSCVAMV